jgi:hypothetical protein
MIELKDIDKALAAFLLENIQKKRGKPSYSDVAKALSIQLGRKINPHYNLAVPLGNVSTLCSELGLPLISARVIYSGANNLKQIGEGFYPLACELKPEYKGMDPITVWKKELRLIESCSDWSRLQNYLDGTDTIMHTSELLIAPISNPFSDWLDQNTELSESSIDKYSGAIRTISREMYQKGTIQKPFENMSPFELDLAIALTMSDPDFIAKNTRGNHMYSNALKQYRFFINSVTEGIDDITYIEKIKNDNQIPETERTEIIQSRVGQGSFRKSLFDKYHGRCIITGINHPKLLIASHIKPWVVSSNKERLSVDNGLLLSATYDRLFDSGLITFDRQGKIFLSSFIGEENVKRLNLSKGLRFDLGISGNMGEYLDYHNDVLFVK